MIKPIFIDTHFIVALGNRQDRYHNQAVDLSKQLKGLPIITTHAVLMDVGNALARYAKIQASAMIQHFRTSPEVQIIAITPQLFDESFALYQRYGDKSWGLVDCISFTVMRQYGISDVLTMDHHFAQAGFHLLMHEE